MCKLLDTKIAEKILFLKKRFLSTLSHILSIDQLFFGSETLIKYSNYFHEIHRNVHLSSQSL